MFRRALSTTLILVLVAALATGCGLTYAKLLPGEDDGGAIVDPTLSTEEVTLRLFFPHWQQIVVLAEERQATVHDGALGQAVVAALLEGPDAPYLKGPLPSDTRLLSLEVVDGVAYVNLNAAAARVNGAMAEMSAIRSLVFTLTELETVDKIHILIEGKSNISLGGHFSLGEPMGRFDIGGTSSTPDIVAASGQILVFGPTPNSFVAGAAFPLWGIAQVYEANLVYELWVDEVLKVEGYITGTDFDWGMFSEAVPLGDIEGNSALLRIYSPSAEDGTPMHLVEIPLTLAQPDIVAESRQIKVFSPAPGTEVGSKFEISGIAQVYEAHLVYEVWQGDVMLVEGFTSTDDWDWGTYREMITVPTGRSGDVVLRIYSPSAKDGSHMFTVEIPLVIR